MSPAQVSGSSPGNRRGLGRAARAAALLTIALSSFQVAANETDQFLLPSDKPFADVGRWISGAHYNVLVAVTDDLNEEIRRAQDIESPSMRQARLDTLHSARRLADMVRQEFGPGFFETLGIESSLQSRLARGAFPGGGYLAFKRSDWIYSFAHLPVDPRNLPLLVPSSTIRVYGHYLGTDKLGHFHDLGHYYFSDYTSKRAAGKSEEEAVREVVDTYSHGLISESAIIGLWGTGVCSNADLVANYMGFKFYRNLTEPVTLQGRQVQPMLVLVGEYWQLNTHVRPDTDFIAPFFSDHWNEALNPCVYEWGLRSAIRQTLRGRSDEVLSFYCGTDHRPRDPGYFTDLARELSSYFGEDYGHFGDPATALGIATTCFEPGSGDFAGPAPPTPEPTPPAQVPAGDVAATRPSQTRADTDTHADPLAELHEQVSSRWVLVAPWAVSARPR